MGSYLTVVNNTPVDWQCKVGPDTHVLKVSGIVFGVVSAALAALSITAAALALVSVTALAGVVLATAAGVAIWGLPAAAVSTGAAAAGVTAGVVAGGFTATALGAIATTAGATSVLSGGAAVIGGTTSFGIAVAGAVHHVLNRKKFDTIRTGTSHRYGKMSLSLWQQSQCVRSIARGRQVVVETVYMRPIFSGATVNSNRNHDIAYWIAKHGTEKYTIQGNAGHPSGKIGDKQIYHLSTLNKHSQ